MTREERIAAIQAELANIERSIAETEARKSAATSLDEIARLDDELVALKARRTMLQLELANLQAAGNEVSALRSDGTGTR